MCRIIPRSRQRIKTISVDARLNSMLYKSSSRFLLRPFNDKDNVFCPRSRVSRVSNFRQILSLLPNILKYTFALVPASLTSAVLTVIR